MCVCVWQTHCLTYLCDDSPPVIRFDGGQVVFWGGVAEGVATQGKSALKSAICDHDVLDRHVDGGERLGLVQSDGADHDVACLRVIVNLFAFHSVKSVVGKEREKHVRKNNIYTLSQNLPIENKGCTIKHMLYICRQKASRWLLFHFSLCLTYPLTCTGYFTTKSALFLVLSDFSFE